MLVVGVGGRAEASNSRRSHAGTLPRRKSAHRPVSLRARAFNSHRRVRRRTARLLWQPGRRRKRRRSDPIRRSSAAGLRERTGGVRPPSTLRSSDNEMQAHARPVQRAIITPPAQLFLHHPSAHHPPIHGAFFSWRPASAAIRLHQSISPPATRSSIHPSIRLPQLLLPLPLHRSLRSIHLHASLANPGVIALHSCLHP